MMSLPGKLRRPHKSIGSCDAGEDDLFSQL